MADADQPTNVAKERFTCSPAQFERIAWAALVTLSLIVFSGAAVRLTQSGLGCPDWPVCYGKPYPPLSSHAMIEFGNRVLSFFVSMAVLGAAIAAMRRRPYRRDLAIWAWLLPLGAFIQAGLGAFTVKSELQYGWVMAHFGLSMVMMIAAVGLVWRARHEPGWREPSSDRLVVWWTRALAAIGAGALFTGTLATAAGPHAGGEPGVVNRWEPKGGESLRWIVMNHGHFAEALGVAALVLWFVLRRRNAPRDLQRAITTVVLLVGAQGVVGMLQWRNQLPAELVWIHIVLATVTWIALIWAAFTAGRLARREP